MTSGGEEPRTAKTGVAKPGKDSTANGSTPAERDRAWVLADFRRIVGPLRGRNQDLKPKS